MPNFTPNFNLKKPLGSENYNIADANGNMDIIDATLGAHIGSGGNAHALAVANGANGFLSGADKALIDSLKTTEPLKLYVNASTGNDANDGKTTATAFKTIQKAVNSVPQVVNHLYEIIITAGIYNEEVTIAGFTGAGALWIKSDSSSYYMAKAFAFDGVTLRTFVDTAEATGKHSVFGCAFFIRGCTNLQMNAIKSVNVDTSYDGVYFEKSTAFIYSAVISSKRAAIFSDYASKVHAGFCSGLGNVYGLQAAHGASLGVEGTQPTGTTNRLVLSGGSIDDGAISASSGNITLYVSPSGNDANDGLTAGAALRTIQAAVNRIPQILNHAATINVAPGIYNESVLIRGFTGKGFLEIFGDTAVSDNYQVNDFVLHYITAKVSVRGFKLLNPNVAAFNVYSCTNVNISHCRTNVPATGIIGILVSRSLVSVSGCDISNRQYAIISSDVSRVFSSTNSGGGNSYVLGAFDASTIGKYGSQPSGATAENTAGGGVIR
ncbi:hypothetical protein [Paenibacillus oleatilyticus]|uniref:hypothetical protein n=1 Tax=Paenibacillus oleatilyticus TaxID=2594886 RepID=UPI001C1FFCB4|nr:hypothetical protein [Paenibacillus oleatilyticus]MBU7320265.1 hypothetical protein [Paenibacillus oleatilyticus]